MGDSIGNILGNVGDAISVGAGGQMNYRNKQIGQQMSTMIGGDDATADNAIRAIAKLDPATANTLQQARLKAKQEALKSQDDHAQSLATTSDKQLEGLDRARGIVSSLLRSSDATSWPQNKALAQQLYKNRGITDYAPIPDVMPSDSSWFDNYGMAPKDLSAASDRSRGRDIQQQNADTNAARADTYSRKAAADTALGAGRLKVQAAQVGSQAQQSAARVGIGAANVMKPPAARGGGRKSATAAPAIPPPMKSTSANQRINDRATNTVWKGDGNGGWVKQ